jgi:coatomer subunit alpha
MIIKFEGDDKRIKGICFHPKRMWVLSSNYAGVINLYDYRMGTLIDSFNEHKGFFFFKKQDLLEELIFIKPNLYS